MIYLKDIKKVDVSLLAELVSILNEDRELLVFLSCDVIKNISVEDFISQNKKWSDENQAELFAVMLEERAIGMISLSHIDKNNKRAQIGYWLASAYWNQGYASQAFSQVLVMAKNKGLESVSGSVPMDNIASQVIWKKFGAKSHKIDNSSCLRFYIDNL